MTADSHHNGHEEVNRKLARIRARYLALVVSAAGGAVLSPLGPGLSGPGGPFKSPPDGEDLCPE